ncbi:MAG: hypothetical protein ABW156_12965, partial [Jiangellaceae bacterium]
MLDAGGGGGTSWSSMTMDEMQKLIQNPDVEKHWELLTGWRRSADLVNEHRAQVQSYRDNLAAAWPPGKSAAAAAYLSRLDDLIANLSETYEAAVANHTAFSTATLSISLAQKEMNELHREHSSNATLLAAHTLAQQERPASGTPSPSPGPSGEQPPVAPGRQDELKWKAIALLSSVSSELAHAQISLVRPTPYKPGSPRDELTDGGGFVPPPIPPITPGSIHDSSRSPATGKPSAQFRVGNTHSGAIAPAIPQPGLVLGGGPTPVITPTLSGGSPALAPIPGGANGPITTPGLLPPATNNFSHPGGTPFPP